MKESSMSFRRVGYPIAMMVLPTALCLLGCKTESTNQAKPDLGQKDIQVVVLADMITSADGRTEYVRFIDAPTAVINELRTKCKQYAIYSVNEINERLIRNPYSSSGREEKVYFLKDMNKEGEILGAKVETVSGDRAVVQAMYHTATSFVAVEYTLKRTTRGWRIKSAKVKYGT